MDSTDDRHRCHQELRVVRRYVSTTRHCQLYDTACHAWIKFAQVAAADWPLQAAVESLQSVTPLSSPTKRTKAPS